MEENSKGLDSTDVEFIGIKKIDSMEALPTNSTDEANKSTAVTFATMSEPMNPSGVLSPDDEDDVINARQKYGDQTGFKYKQAMKLMIPIRLKPTKEQYSPLDHCGFLSFLWMSWMSPIFFKAYKKTLEYIDLWTMSDYDRGEYNGDRFEKLWQEEIERKGNNEAGLGKVAFRFVRTRQIISIAALVVSTMSSFLTSALLVQWLLEYVELDSAEADLWYGIVLVIGILLLNILRIVSEVFFWVFSCRTATRLRSGILSVAFRRLAHLRSLKNHSVGEIVNVCGNDSQRLFDVCVVGNFLASSVVILIATIVAAQLIVGPGALIGTIVTFFIFLPLQMIVGTVISKVRRKCISVIDTRVQKMNEILTFIKLIKMYAWEKPFAKTIAAIRSKERGYLETAGMLQSFSLTIVPIVPSLASVISIIVHVSLGYNLTAAEAFTLISLLNVMRVVLGPTPFAIRMLAESSVALGRLKDIMVLEKMEPNEKLSDNSENMVEISGATFGWDIIQGEEDKDSVKDGKANGNAGKVKPEKNRNQQVVKQNGKTANGSVSSLSNSQNGHIALQDVDVTSNNNNVSPALFDIDLKLRKGNLTGVCGLVGSGKTSLISAILGQMQKMKGTCRVNGRFAYVAQEAWIFNATVQENILFGHEMDTDRYNMVLGVCSLKQDLEILTDGDQTEIGERGINLSGGQKQRISLARAVYADYDVYFLDDPLSAVDAHVGEHIFNKCIKGILRGKTILFVTHQLQYLQDCDSIVVMQEGHIAEQGDHKALMDQGGEYARLITTHYTKAEESEEEAENGPMSPKLTKQLSRQKSISRSVASDAESVVSLPDAGQLTTNEERSGGGLTWKTYHGYIQAMGGYFNLFAILFAYILVVGLLTFNNWWLTYWIENSGNRPYNETLDEEPPTLVNDPELGFYMLIYGVSLIVIFILAALKSIVYMKLTLKSSSTLHNDLFKKVFRSPMSFFDTTPTGRILNRFSKDMDELDVMLPINMELSLTNIMMIGASLLTITVVFPYFLIAVIPIIIIFYFVMIFYRRGVNDMKQLENVSRSPWFSHIGSTAMGLATIHAYRKTGEFITKFVDLLDVNAYPLMLFRMATRWAGARLELLVVLIITVTNLMVVLTHQYGSISPSVAGLVVSYAIQLTGLFQLTMTMLADTEARFFSAERILQYNRNLESEAPETVRGKKPVKEWPDQGTIQFNEYRMRYRDNLPLVLKDVNCNIRAGEKIGIVGRTGSGKSTLSVALFRLVEADEGTITIDDINIGEIGLTDLRSRISIIPQDPVLFMGTIRYNLDPFNERSDDELWQALEKAYMKDKISTLDSQLEAPVTEGGDNFSVGERQLLCMARALLRNSKILFLDEATAAIDTETDSLIQQTIRTAFSSCTTLTIAHRLNTVLDSDRILVMDDGKVAEFDSPSVLRSNPRSIFSGMVAAAEAQNNGKID